MTTAKHAQNYKLTLETNAGEIKIPTGSTWLVSEGDDWTQVGLDRPGHPLDGLTVAMDWSQGLNRPHLKLDRIRAILGDADMLAMHANDLLESAKIGGAA